MTALKFWRGISRGYDRLLMIVLIVILLIVCYCMYDNYWVYSHTIDDSILKYKPTAQGYVPSESPISDDMAAWLTIDGTNIDYPVMQSTDNIKYLNTDPYGGYSLSGSIFLDSRNSPEFTDRYSVIYGHHMEYGKMFGAIDDFLDEDYLSAHSTGELIIGKDARKVYKLRVFAAMRASARSEEIFDVLKGGDPEYISSHADVKISEPEGRIVALTTCAGSDQVSRIAVFCYIIE